MKRLIYLIKFIHGETATSIDYFLVHVFPIVMAAIFRYCHSDIFVTFSGLQLFFYYIFVWELLGGIFANLSASTNYFWQTQPLKYRYYFMLLHSWHPIIWFLIFKVDILFCLVYFLFMCFSTIFLLKKSNRYSLLLTLILTFGGILMCKWLEVNYNPFPFGLEWVPYIFFIKLIFAFTLQYKK
jgi:hypothetical protein